MRTINTLMGAALLLLAACSPAPAASPSAAPSAEPSAAPATPAAPTPVGTALPPGTTEAELELLTRIRLDLTTACAPLRTDLPEGAVAGVECTPGGDVVERAAIYLFDTKDALLTTYTAELAAHDVPVRTNGGRCEPGRASEGGYVPGDDHGIEVAERGGCWIDAEGTAHYVATLPPFVLIKVDGAGGDVTAVERWAWLGNQDQPGAPTVWREGGPASPEK